MFKAHRKASEAKKAAILKFYDRHGRFPKERAPDKEEHQLGYSLNHYLSKSQPVYDPQFETVVRSLGRERGEVSKHKKAVLEFCAKHQRQPSGRLNRSEKELVHWIGAYTSVRSGQYDPDFAQEVAKYPYVKGSLDPIKAIQRQKDVVEFFEANGRWPVSGAMSKAEWHAYDYLVRATKPGSEKYDAAFAAKVAAMGYVRPEGRPKRTRRSGPDFSVKLTPEKVIAIRTTDVAEGLGCNRTAKKYGIDRSTVLQIRARKIWKNLP